MENANKKPVSNLIAYAAVSDVKKYFPGIKDTKELVEKAREHTKRMVKNADLNPEFVKKLEEDGQAYRAKCDSSERDQIEQIMLDI